MTLLAILLDMVADQPSSIQDIALYLLSSGSLLYIIVQHLIKSRERKKSNDEKEIEEYKRKLNEINERDQQLISEYKEKIESLTSTISNLQDEKLDLTVNLAKLQERVLLHAKNRVKRRIQEDDDDIHL